MVIEYWPLQEGQAGAIVQEAISLQRWGMESRRTTENILQGAFRKGCLLLQERLAVTIIQEAISVQKGEKGYIPKTLSEEGWKACRC